MPVQPIAFFWKKKAHHILCIKNLRVRKPPYPLNFVYRLAHALPG